MSSKYQTLSEFLLNPFGTGNNLNKDITYNSKYTAFVTKNRIRLKAVCEIEGSYYFHITIPSESLKEQNLNYDVVIRFFSDDPKIRNQNSLSAYHIQFYSNSPSFIYKYAYVYNKEGYLIKALYNKLDADYLDVPPSKTNSDLKIYYDKSIYFACRYLNETASRNLTKTGPAIRRKINQDKFFKGIADFRTIKFTQELVAQEKKLLKEVESDGKERSITVDIDKVNDDKKVGLKTITGKKIMPKMSTGKHRVVNITAKKKISGKSKITSKTSTKKK